MGNFKLTARSVAVRLMQVDVEIDRTKHDLGLLDEGERHGLAEALLSAVYDLRAMAEPSFPEWFAARLQAAGVPFPEIEMGES